MENIKNIIENADNLSGKEVVEKYNIILERLGRKTVTKVASRAKGIELIKKFGGELLKIEGVPQIDFEGIDEEVPAVEEVKAEEVKAENIVEVKAQPAEASEIRKMNVQQRQNISFGVERSWKVPEIAAKRMQRNGCNVTVEGGEVLTFKSVPEAFRYFGLPMKNVISFRMSLKAEKKIAFNEMLWEIIE